MCTHHWIIEAAGGPKSPGVCIKCGKMGLFANYVESAIEFDFRTKSHKRQAERPFNNPKEDLAREGLALEVTPNAHRTRNLTPRQSDPDTPH